MRSGAMADRKISSRRKGPSGEVDATWKETIKREMKNQGFRPVDYARKIDIPTNSLHMALSPDQKGTRFKRVIMEGLGLPYLDTEQPVAPPTPEQLVERIVEAVGDLSAEDRELVLELAERLARDT